MAERLGVVVDCALNKYINRCLNTPGAKLRLPERIEEPEYLWNNGYRVTLIFSDDAYPGAVISVTIDLSWTEDIDVYTKRLAKKYRNEVLR